MEENTLTYSQCFFLESTFLCISNEIFPKIFKFKDSLLKSKLTLGEYLSMVSVILRFPGNSSYTKVEA